MTLFFCINFTKFTTVNNMYDINRISIQKVVMLLRIDMLIRKIREEKNISLDELSKEANVSKAHLSYIERNKKEPTISVLVKI